MGNLNLIWRFLCWWIKVSTAVFVFLSKSGSWNTTKYAFQIKPDNTKRRRRKERIKCTRRDPLTTIFVVGHLSSSLPRPTGLNLSGAKNSSFTRVIVIYVFLVIFVNWAKFCLQSSGLPIEGCHKIIILIVWLSQTKCTCTRVFSLGLLMAHSIPSFSFPRPASHGFKP